MAFKTLGSFNIQFCVKVDLEIPTPGANLFTPTIVKSEQFITLRAAYFFHAIYLLAHGVHSVEEVRCPKCNKLLGFYDGKGEQVCPRCRDLKIYFDTELNIKRTERLERH